MSFAIVELTVEQRLVVESAVPQVCDRGGWTCHAVAAGPDHVHALVSADTDPKVVRRLLKRWLSQALSERWPMQPGRSWWADGGSTQWVWKPEYLQHACEYIARQATVNLRSP